MKYLKPFEKFTALNQVRIKTFEQFELDWSETDEIFVSDLKEEKDSEEVDNQEDVDDSESES